MVAINAYSIQNMHLWPHTIRWCKRTVSVSVLFHKCFLSTFCVATVYSFIHVFFFFFIRPKYNIVSQKQNCWSLEGLIFIQMQNIQNDMATLQETQHLSGRKSNHIFVFHMHSQSSHCHALCQLCIQRMFAVWLSSPHTPQMSTITTVAFIICQRIYARLNETENKRELCQVEGRGLEEGFPGLRLLLRPLRAQSMKGHIGHPTKVSCWKPSFTHPSVASRLENIVHPYRNSRVKQR